MIKCTVPFQLRDPVTVNKQSHRHAWIWLQLVKTLPKPLHPLSFWTFFYLHQPRFNLRHSHCVPPTFRDYVCWCLAFLQRLPSFFLFRALWERLRWTVCNLLGSEISIPSVKQRRILVKYIQDAKHFPLCKVYLLHLQRCFEFITGSSLTPQPSVCVREGAQGPRWGRQEDLGDPGQELPGDAVCREERRAAGRRLQAERRVGERRRRRN